MNVFARNLRFLRKQRGLNQDEVSALFNKRANTVGNWENSKSEPSIGELVRLAAYFKVGLHELLHTDLQKETLNALDAAAAPAPEFPVNAYPLNDSITSMAQDGSSDSFWLILRELRTMNEKLDSLKSAVESGLRRQEADKSNH